MKASRRIVVSNDLGLHLRAAGVFVQVAGLFSSDIRVIRDSSAANAKSIMSVLALAASKGVELEIVAEGVDAEEAVGALTALVERGFEPE